MKYQIFKPPVALANLVQCFWCLESCDNEMVPQQYYLMADSCAEIIFQYNEGFKKFSAQSARMRFQHSVHNNFEVGDKVGFFGVRLFPHAVKQLLGIPANEVVNEVFDFCSAFKQGGRSLADQIYNSKTVEEKVALVTAFLIKKAHSHNIDVIKYFVDKVIRFQGRVDVLKLQQESGLSVRQFERRFKAVAGFPPKYFSRIARFQAVKDSYSAQQHKTMSALTYSGVYYDQSHFNREFKEFSGVQPLQYFRSAVQDHAGEDASVLNSKLPTGKFKGYLPCGWFA